MVVNEGCYAQLSIRRGASRSRCGTRGGRRSSWVYRTQARYAQSGYGSMADIRWRGEAVRAMRNLCEETAKANSCFSRAAPGQV